MCISITLIKHVSMPMHINTLDVERNYDTSCYVFVQAIVQKATLLLSLCYELLVQGIKSNQFLKNLLIKLCECFIHQDLQKGPVCIVYRERMDC